MAPKNNAKGGDKKGAAKGKGKDAEDAGGKGKGKGGLKAASSINVRHILVRPLPFVFHFIFASSSNGDQTCREDEI
jgi:hypothetical protein